METVKQETAKGTHLFDALRKEPRGTVKKWVVEETQDKIRRAIADAKYHFETSKDSLLVLGEQIKKEINSPNVTSIKFTRLKKLQAKNIEAKQKLAEVRPKSIGQALRISGVNPADISILMIYLKKEYHHE